MKSANFLNKFFVRFLPVKGWIMILYIMTCQYSLFSQEFTLTAEYSFILNFVGEDSFLNKYSLDNGVLHQHSPQNQVASYSNRQYGPVTYVDVSDPLNIIVFFRNFGVIVFLDKNLTEKKIITPAGLITEEEIPSFVCHSSRHGFWAYYPDIFVLKRFNMRPSVEASSHDLSHSPGISSVVKYMQESDERLFVWSDGIWVFDLHSNFLFSVQHIQTPLIQVKQNRIFYSREGLLVVYDLILGKEDVILLPETRIKNFFIKDGSTLFLQSDVSLKEYNFSGKFY